VLFLTAWVHAAPATKLQLPARALDLTWLPYSPARLTAYLEQQEDEASLTAFSTASRVSPVRF